MAIADRTAVKPPRPQIIVHGVRPEPKGWTSFEPMSSVTVMPTGTCMSV